MCILLSTSYRDDRQTHLFVWHVSNNTLHVKRWHKFRTNHCQLRIEPISRQQEGKESDIFLVQSTADLPQSIKWNRNIDIWGCRILATLEVMREIKRALHNALIFVHSCLFLFCIWRHLSPEESKIGEERVNTLSHLTVSPDHKLLH